MLLFYLSHLRNRFHRHEPNINKTAKTSLKSGLFIGVQSDCCEIYLSVRWNSTIIQWSVSLTPIPVCPALQNCNIVRPRTCLKLTGPHSEYSLLFHACMKSYENPAKQRENTFWHQTFRNEDLTKRVGKRRLNYLRKWKNNNNNNSIRIKTTRKVEKIMVLWCMIFFPHTHFPSIMSWMIDGKY